jgi:predicted enzyme related to lactoylglutathione lyase
MVMGDRSSYPPGTFCWVDLAATNASAGKAFYSELFGWTAVDLPTDVGSVYTMFELDGKAVCGLWPMNDEMQRQGIPPSWQSYVSVESADRSTEQATALGAVVMMEPADVMQAGRMAVIRDPTGASLALWEPREHIGADIVNLPGALCWNELQTRDTAAAQAFYTALFGWTAATTSGTAGSEYWELRNDGALAGGMMQIRPEWGDVAPNWAVYFAVDDCDGTVDRALDLDGRLLVPAMDAEGIGRFAFLQDKLGAVFAVIALEGPDS